MREFRWFLGTTKLQRPSKACYPWHVKLGSPEGVIIRTSSTSHQTIKTMLGPESLLEVRTYHYSKVKLILWKNFTNCPHGNHVAKQCIEVHGILQIFETILTIIHRVFAKALPGVYTELPLHQKVGHLQHLLQGPQIGVSGSGIGQYSEVA